MKKLSKDYTKKSRNKLYGCYLTHRLKHPNLNFERYCVLHEKNIEKYTKAGRNWVYLV